MDISWDMSSTKLENTVPPESVPQRFSLVAPQCVIRQGEELLVLDPHPGGTWMTWMFPYASLILSAEDATAVGGSRSLAPESLTYRSLSDFLQELRSGCRQSYDAAIRAEVNNVLPGIGPAWQGTPVFENYSLKFSKTSNSYTAYLFEYFVNAVDDLPVDLPHLWVPLADASSKLTSEAQVYGRSVSSNVVEALPAIISSQLV